MKTAVKVGVALVLGMGASLVVPRAALAAPPVHDCPDREPGETNCPTDFCEESVRCAADIKIIDANFRCCNDGVATTWSVKFKTCEYTSLLEEVECNDTIAQICTTWFGYTSGGTCTTIP